MTPSKTRLTVSRLRIKSGKSEVSNNTCMLRFDKRHHNGYIRLNSFDVTGTKSVQYPSRNGIYKPAPRQLEAILEAANQSVIVPTSPTPHLTPHSRSATRLHSQSRLIEAPIHPVYRRYHRERSTDML